MVLIVNKTQDSGKTALIIMTMVIMALVVYLCVKIGNPFLPPVTQAENQVIQAQQSSEQRANSPYKTGAKVQNTMNTNSQDMLKAFINSLKNRRVDEARQNLSITGGGEENLQSILQELETVDRIDYNQPEVVKAGQKECVSVTITSSLPGEERPCLINKRTGKVYDLCKKDTSGKYIYTKYFPAMVTNFTHSVYYERTAQKLCFNREFSMIMLDRYYCASNLGGDGQRVTIAILCKGVKNDPSMGIVNKQEFETAFGLHRGDKFRLEKRKLPVVSRRQVVFTSVNTDSGWKITEIGFGPKTE